MTVRRTSIEAYNTIKENGLLSKRRWEVYEVLFNYGPLTGGEIGRKMASYRSAVSTADRNIHARLTELRNFGVVYEVGERDCRVTGMSVIEWDVTEALPVKFEKPTRIKCPHCKGKGYISEQQAKLF